MPNMTGVSAIPFFRIGLVALNACDRLAPRAIVAGGFQFGDHRGQRLEVLDRLIVRRLVAARPVEIGLAHVERIEAALARDAVDHALDREHALWTAEAAKGGVGDGVGLQAARGDAYGLQPIGVGGVEHRAVDDAEREVGRAAAARVQHDFVDADPPGIVVADAPVGAKIVALAGQHEIVVAVEPDLAGRAGDLGAERGDRRPGAGLALLAAEAAAHPPRLDADERVGNAEDPRDDMLHLGRVLRRGVHEHLGALAGDRERGLALEIEMLLPADP